MSCFRIMDDNFADLSLLANVDVSSEQGSFPASNTYAQKRRAKLWRTEGYFNIVSPGNTIVFQEDGATDRTATVAVAEYSSRAALHTAIAAAFNAAAGTATYSVTTDATTLRTTITSDGGGGATFDIIWTDAASATMAGLLGFDTGSDNSSSLSYSSDSLTIAQQEYITFDMGLPTDCTVFAMTGRRNSSVALSTTGTYKIQASPTDEWVTPSFSQDLTYDSETIFAMSDTSLAGAAYRYWRLSLSDISNANGYLELSNVHLGTYYTPPTGKVQFGLQSQLLDRSQSDFTEGGQLISLTREKSQSFNVRWFNLKKAEINQIEELFEKFGTSKPFFISMDTEAAWSPTANMRFKYVRFRQQPTFTLENADIFSMSMSFQEEI